MKGLSFLMLCAHFYLKLDTKISAFNKDNLNIVTQTFCIIIIMQRIFSNS